MESDVRDNAIVMLGRYPNTSELVPTVSAARRAGALTDGEFSDICAGRASRSPIGADRWQHDAFAAGDLLAAGVHVADSSDAPITCPDWRRGIDLRRSNKTGPQAV